MIQLISRGGAIVGWLAHVVGRLARSVIWFAPRGFPWAPLIGVLLMVGAWSSIRAANAVTAAQPRPEPVGLADVVDSRVTGWVGTSSIVRGPFLDSSSYGAPVQRWYYLLLDPTDPDVAMIARSPERLEERRTRTIVARVELDPDAVAAALSGREPLAHTVDADRYLVEQPDRPDMLTGDSIATPTGHNLDETELVFRGTFGRGRPSADGEGWEYLASEGGRAVVVRSPHPPDALPVDVWGVAATDPVRTEQAAAVPGLRASLEGRRVPDRRLLAEGVSPPLPEVSYIPAMVMGALGLLLVIGWLTGYPLFRRGPVPDSISTWPMQPGDEIPADLYGTDARGGVAVTVDGAPARIALLAGDELERRSWQFAVADAAAVAPSAAGAAGGLTLSSGEGPILLRLDPTPHDLRLAGGKVVHAARSRPALRFRGTHLDLVAAFATDADRDRAVAAIIPGRMGSVRDGRPPHAERRQRAPSGGGAVPVPLRAAAILLLAVGAILVGGGAIGLPDAVTGGSGLLPSLAQVAAGIGVAVVGRGVWLRRGWAEGIGFTLGWVGAAIAAFLVVAAPQCGLWLAPNLAACQAIGPVGSAAALAAAIGLAYAALAIHRYASAFAR